MVWDSIKAPLTNNPFHKGIRPEDPNPNHRTPKHRILTISWPGKNNHNIMGFSRGGSKEQDPYFFLWFSMFPQKGSLTNPTFPSYPLLLDPPTEGYNIDSPKKTWMPFTFDTVDGRNPANLLRLVVYPIICQVLYIPSGAGFLPSTVVLVVFLFPVHSPHRYHGPQRNPTIPFWPSTKKQRLMHPKSL